MCFKCTIPRLPGFDDGLAGLTSFSVLFSAYPSHSLGSVTSSCPSSWFILHHVQGEDILFVFSLVPEWVVLMLSGIWVHHIYFLLGMAFCDSVSLHLTYDSWNAHKHLVSQPHYAINSHELNVTHAFCFSYLCSSFFFSFWTHAPLKSSSPVKLFLSRQTILASRSSSYHFLLKN